MKIQKLIPECKDYIWGGSKLIREYGKVFRYYYGRLHL